MDAAGNVTVVDCDCQQDQACYVETDPTAPLRDEGGIAGGPNGCIVPNDGGTVDLPPAGCDYLSPNDVHMIIDGLPPNTEIHLAPIHSQIFCKEQNNVCSFPPGVECEQPGGDLGGQKDVRELEHAIPVAMRFDGSGRLPRRPGRLGEAGGLAIGGF